MAKILKDLALYPLRAFCMKLYLLLLNVYFQSFNYVNKRALYKLKDKSLNILSIIFLNGCVIQDAKILSPAMMSFPKLLIHIYDCLLNISNFMSQKHLKINMPKTEQTFDFSLSLKLPSSDLSLKQPFVQV